MAKKTYPDWVEKHRRKGTNISCNDGRYYLYECTSKWDKEKGRAKKITGAYLGRITENGFIPKGSKAPKSKPTVTVKEYGATAAAIELGEDLLNKLREKFGKSGEVVFAIALSRLIEQSPFKRTEIQYSNSYISEILPDLKLSSKDISIFNAEFGKKRNEIVEFMRGFIGDDAHILFDGTSIISNSQNMNINRPGYNSHGKFDPQFNLMYAFSVDVKQPVYYRVIPGNIRDMSALSLSLQESGMRNGIVVADKGFGSDDNFKEINASGLKYVVPLKRNSTEIDYSAFKESDKSNFDGFFMYQGKQIWYKRNGNIHSFLNPEMKVEEERTYLANIERNCNGFTLENFHAKQHTFGTITLKTNVDSTSKEIYLIYKQRGEIEQSFDFLKNLLEQDKSYMQSETSLESWAFINHIALLLCYRIYSLLKQHDVISQYSVADFLSHLKYIKKVKVDGVWCTSEINKKTAKLLDKIGLHITHDLKS